ncbi:MAG: ornithine carbamoyltransferase [Planctomycetes bacterium]|nr:ornithine carbamoyltransferase [Planctomycetota bacterium]
MGSRKSLEAAAPRAVTQPGSAHFISIADWSRPKLEELLRLSFSLKEYPEQHAHSLDGRVLLMMFQKPSLRTRVSFETAMARLGGHAIAYDLSASPWGHGRETAADTARTASRYVDAIMARLFSHDDMLALAAHSSVPVINGLSDLEHPCQALGDLMTLQEQFGSLQGLRLAYVGDGNNNVTHSLLDACSRMGIHLSIGCPRGQEFEPDAKVLARARGAAVENGARIEIGHDARAAVAGANAVYTDTWMSYHIAPERREQRELALLPFRVTTPLMQAARRDAVFMHCLPAWRGKELDADVIDGPQSIVFAQAENRLYTEKAILLSLIR